MLPHSSRILYGDTIFLFGINFFILFTGVGEEEKPSTEQSGI
jgi:hypothetical protein